MRPHWLGVACVVSFLSGLQAEKAVPQRYEAATIKPCVPEEKPTAARGTVGGTNASISPGRFHVPCVTAEQLIYLAYAAQGAKDDEHLINDGLGGASNETKVRGGPAWVHSLGTKFEIEATAPGATERTVLMGTMLRSLLEDRFKLKLHREVEQVDMFALTARGGAIKPAPMKPGDCNADTSAPPDPTAAKPPCGMINTSPRGPNLVWTLVGVDVATLAGRLSRTVGLHVIDQTGIKGEFIMRLEFHPDHNTPGLVWPSERDADTSAPQAPTIFTALEEQLGLKLAKTKAPRGFIVIDHIEKPGPQR
jgi:uncharacterized protein (TIGR03435 family)